MELSLMYVHAERIGYGRLGTLLAAELEKMGVTVYDAIEGDPRRTATDGDKQGKTNLACWVSTPSHARGWWKGQTTSMFTMYEAMELPASFTENLHEFETIIVPSRQNQELFSRYHDNVQFLPLGVDPETWHYTPRREGRDFNFLIGGSGNRKGVDLAYLAFLEVFGEEGSWGNGPIPHLIFKSPRGLEATDHPRMTMVAGYLTADDEVGLYEQAHCYLQPSRGEGFGLQPLQAIAQGIPTILTDAHGHDSFAQLGYGLDSTHHPSDYFMYGDSGDWWEPDFEQLCDMMWGVYNDYADALKFAKQSAETVAQHFTWRNCAEGFLNILGRDRLTPYQGTGEWYSPTSKLYEVIVNRTRVVDAGGLKRLYVAGKTYYEPADLKRILFDTGALDPACLKGEDIGLAPEQLGDVAEYSAAAEWCPTCEQRLNSGISRSDALFAAESGVEL